MKMLRLSLWAVVLAGNSFYAVISIYPNIIFLYQIQKKFISTFISLQGRIIFNMTMSVNDENSAGAANNNNCSKTADLDDHYVNSPGDLRSQMWPPCPPPPPPPSSAWLPDEPPTYTPLVKVRLFTYSVNIYLSK